jgi:hypothetical protein
MLKPRRLRAEEGRVSRAPPARPAMSTSPMPLLLIIPVAWLAVGVIVVMLCRGAKQGDVVLDETIEPARRMAAMSGVVILRDATSLLSAEQRPPSGPPLASIDGRAGEHDAQPNAEHETVLVRS